jgi:predicted lipoprotein with Yx(FWY)xxD motif
VVASRRRTRITSGNSAYGKILFNRNRQAIYIFDKENSKRSKCYGSCSSAWPPVLTKGKGKPNAKGKVKQRLLGTTKRSGGARQVTYNGHPLYYYVDDPPGQVLCHNVNEFGGLWLVVQPDGQPAPPDPS